MRLDSFFFGALCVMSGGRLPEALFMVFLSDSKGAKACKSCRSRQELSIEYLLAKFGFDTAEKEPEYRYGVSLIFVSLIFGPDLPDVASLPPDVLGRPDAAGVAGVEDERHLSEDLNDSWVKT